MKNKQQKAWELLEAEMQMEGHFSKPKFMRLLRKAATQNAEPKAGKSKNQRFE